MKFSISIFGLLLFLTICCDHRSESESKLESMNATHCHDLVQNFKADISFDSDYSIKKFDLLLRNNEYDSIAHLLIAENPKSDVFNEMIMRSDTLALFNYVVNYKNFVFPIGDQYVSLDYSPLKDHSLPFICKCYEMFWHSSDPRISALFPRIRDAGFMLNDSSSRAHFIVSHNSNFIHGALSNIYGYYLNEISQGRTKINDPLLRNILPFVKHDGLLKKLDEIGAISYYKKTAHHIKSTHPVIQNMSDATLEVLVNRLLLSDGFTKKIGERLKEDLNNRKN